MFDRLHNPRLATKSFSRSRTIQQSRPHAIGNARAATSILQRQKSAAHQSATKPMTFEELQQHDDTNQGPYAMNATTNRRKNNTIFHRDKLELNRDATTGAVFLNEYLVVQNLGQGSFGKVRLVMDMRTNRLRAVKMVNKQKLQVHNMMARVRNKDNSKDPEVVLRREIDVMKKLHHDHVVRLFEVIDDPSGSELLMVMEFVDGGPLLKQDAKGNSEPMAESSARQYFCQVLLGLCYLHAYGVVHGDIKPDNLLLASSGTVKITDFGSAVVIAPGESDLLCKTMGTPAYLAPEVCAGENFSGEKQDFWALGVTLYALVCGRLPFQGNNIWQLYENIIESPLEFPPEVKMSELLVDLLTRMLTKEVDQRLDADGVRTHPWITSYGRFPSKFESLPFDTSEEASIDLRDELGLLRRPIPQGITFTTIVCEQGEYLFRQGDTSTDMFIIREGAVEIILEDRKDNKSLFASQQSVMASLFEDDEEDEEDEDEEDEEDEESEYEDDDDEEEESEEDEEEEEDEAHDGVPSTRMAPMEAIVERSESLDSLPVASADESAVAHSISTAVPPPPTTDLKPGPLQRFLSRNRTSSNASSNNSKLLQFDESRGTSGKSIASDDAPPVQPTPSMMRRAVTSTPRRTVVAPSSAKTMDSVDELAGEDGVGRRASPKPRRRAPMLSELKANAPNSPSSSLQPRGNASMMRRSATTKPNRAGAGSGSGLQRVRDPTEFFTPTFSPADWETHRASRAASLFYGPNAAKGAESKGHGALPMSSAQANGTTGHRSSNPDGFGSTPAVQRVKSSNLAGILSKSKELRTSFDAPSTVSPNSVVAVGPTGPRGSGGFLARIFSRNQHTAAPSLTPVALPRPIVPPPVAATLLDNHHHHQLGGAKSKSRTPSPVTTTDGARHRHSASSPIADSPARRKHRESGGGPSLSSAGSSRGPLQNRSFHSSPVTDSQHHGQSPSSATGHIDHAPSSRVASPSGSLVDPTRSSRRSSRSRSRTPSPAPQSYRHSPVLSIGDDGVHTLTLADTRLVPAELRDKMLTVREHAQSRIGGSTMTPVGSNLIAAKTMDKTDTTRPPTFASHHVDHSSTSLTASPTPRLPRLPPPPSNQSHAPFPRSMRDSPRTTVLLEEEEDNSHHPSSSPVPPPVLVTAVNEPPLIHNLEPLHGHSSSNNSPAVGSHRASHSHHQQSLHISAPLPPIPKDFLGGSDSPLLDARFMRQVSAEDEGISPASRSILASANKQSAIRSALKKHHDVADDVGVPAPKSSFTPSVAIPKSSSPTAFVLLAAGGSTMHSIEPSDNGAMPSPASGKRRGGVKFADEAESSDESETQSVGGGARGPLPAVHSKSRFAPQPTNNPPGILKRMFSASSHPQQHSVSIVNSVPEPLSGPPALPPTKPGFLRLLSNKLIRKTSDSTTSSSAPSRFDFVRSKSLRKVIQDSVRMLTAQDRLISKKNNSERVLSVSSVGAVVGEMAALGLADVRTASARARERTVVTVIARATLRQWFALVPELQEELRRTMASRRRNQLIFRTNMKLRSLVADESKRLEVNENEEEEDVKDGYDPLVAPAWSTPRPSMNSSAYPGKKNDDDDDKEEEEDKKKESHGPKLQVRTTLPPGAKAPSELVPVETPAPRHLMGDSLLAAVKQPPEHSLAPPTLPNSVLSSSPVSLIPRTSPVPTLIRTLPPHLASPSPTSSISPSAMPSALLIGRGSPLPANLQPLKIVKPTITRYRTPDVNEDEMAKGLAKQPDSAPPRTPASM